ncbi:galanin receptor type 1-like isoform X1 [Mytilus galloprovincialis]|uniref:galanin receptor type 1-like isoform X1 n=2 Tax=Mytilus galloprovincialis TaxID=29158 RepID=UPI003F7B8777
MQERSDNELHKVADGKHVLGMDQLADWFAYKDLISRNNITWNRDSPYNFSDPGSVFEEFQKRQFTIHEYSTIVLLSLYVIIFFIGLLGNALIIVTTIRNGQSQHSKNYFLINLAVADLAVTLCCMPTSLGTIIYRIWVYGKFLCKFVAFFQGVAVAVSVYSLTAMSIDRYLSIQNPMASRKFMTKRQCLIMIAAMWIISALFMGPLLYIKTVDTIELDSLPSVDFCIEQWPQERDRKAYVLFLLFVVFLIPGVTLAVCYSHVGRALCSKDMTREGSDTSTRGLFSRKKAARMIIILIIVFMLCWLPYNIASLVSDLSDDFVLILLFFTLWLGHAHSAINPVMFWLLNRRFREKVRVLVKSVKKNTFSCTSTSSMSLPAYV